MYSVHRGSPAKPVRAELARRAPACPAAFSGFSGARAGEALTLPGTPEVPSTRTRANIMGKLQVEVGDAIQFGCGRKRGRK
jgi:hypothetical protein